MAKRKSGRDRGASLPATEPVPVRDASIQKTRTEDDRQRDLQHVTDSQRLIKESRKKIRSSQAIIKRAARSAKKRR